MQYKILVVDRSNKLGTYEFIYYSDIVPQKDDILFSTIYSDTLEGGWKVVGRALSTKSSEANHIIVSCIKVTT